MKVQRQRKILEIIEKYDIDTQEALIEKLKEAGFNVTQTTASRDIRQLKLVKGTSGRGTYKYISPNTAKPEGSVPVLKSAIHTSVVKIEAAQNIVVVKTLSGIANAGAVGIDSLDIPGLVGSVAGDDTILLVVKDNDAAIEAVASLNEVFGA